MTTVCQCDKFVKYMKGLRDQGAKAKILLRIQRLEAGNPGDVEPVGAGVSEMRIHYGPGYRVYFKQTGDVATILTAGDKDSQASDIEDAKKLASELGE